MEIPQSRIHWKNSFRIIPSRCPTIHPFEKIAPSQDWEILFEIEGLTNDRLRHQRGEISYFDESKILTQENRSYVLAPFIHLNPDGSRFSDGTWGVYYAAKNLNSAIAETKYHREIFMAATQEKAMNLEMRVIHAQIKGVFDDIRKMGTVPKNIFDPKSYSASQKFSQSLQKKKSNGVLYLSVRDPEQGDCIAVFKPELLSLCRIEKHLLYRWDGEKISHVWEIKEL